MRQKPVAWVDPKELDMDVSTTITKNKQFDSDIPLYTAPREWYEINKNGYVNPADRALEDRLSNDEINGIWHGMIKKGLAIDIIEFARELLKKASER